MKFLITFIDHGDCDIVHYEIVCDSWMTALERAWLKFNNENQPFKDVCKVWQELLQE